MYLSGFKNYGRHYEQRIQKTPHNKRPVCTMPETTHQKNDEYVPDVKQLAAMIASQRDIQIIPEPSRERNVPALPEIGNVFCEIGISEIAH